MREGLSVGELVAHVVPEGCTAKPASPGQNEGPAIRARLRRQTWWHLPRMQAQVQPPAVVLHKPLSFSNLVGVYFVMKEMKPYLPLRRGQPLSWIV